MVFSVFILQVLSRASEDCVTYWQFSVSSVGAICGEDTTCKLYDRFLDKELHGAYSLNGGHQ